MTDYQATVRMVSDKLCEMCGFNVGIENGLLHVERALATLRDRLAAAERGQKEAIAQMCKTSRELGEAQGKLAASELPGIIDSWRERALDAEREIEEVKEKHLFYFDVSTKQQIMLTDVHARAYAAESRVTQLTEALEKAREGLEPFAEVAEHDIGDSEADNDWFRPMNPRYARAPLLCVGVLRRARATLAAIDAALKGE
jgi:hypothetical protein